MFGRQFIVTGLVLMFSVIRAGGQEQPMPGMPGMNHGASPPGQATSQPPPAMGSMNMVEMNPASMYLMNLASGTSSNPASWPMPMVMTHFGAWNAMLMGAAFVVDTQQ